MTESIVGAIAPNLEQAEIERAKRKPTESLDAYDFFLRGMASFHQQTTGGHQRSAGALLQGDRARRQLRVGLRMAAWCYVWRKVNGWLTDRAQEVEEGARLARRATELGKHDAVALAWGGHALALLLNDFDSGIAFVDRALVLNPNLAAAWILSGFLRMFRGEPDVSLAHFAHSMRLSPLDPQTFRMQTGTALLHLLAGRFDDASSWAEKAFRDQPNFLVAIGVISGKQRARRAHEGSARSHAAAAPDRSCPAHRESQGLAPDPAPGGLCQVVGWVAQGGVARVAARTIPAGLAAPGHRVNQCRTTNSSCWRISAAAAFAEMLSPARAPESRARATNTRSRRLRVAAVLAAPSPSVSRIRLSSLRR